MIPQLATVALSLIVVALIDCTNGVIVLLTDAVNVAVSCPISVPFKYVYNVTVAVPLDEFGNSAYHDAGKVYECELPETEISPVSIVPNCTRSVFVLPVVM